MVLVFSVPTVKSTKKLLKNNSNCVVALLLFYENINITVFRVLGPVIYFIIIIYDFVDYLCLHQGLLSLTKQVEKNTFDNISGVRIREVSMNIVSCCGFSKEDNETVILNF